MAVLFKISKKDIFMTEEDEEDYRNNISRFCEKNIESDKVRDPCQLTGKYRSRADKKCKIIIP